jgi:hypothetical protein
MIKITNIETSNWEAAIRGMRNPMNSWDKSDSWFRDYDGYHKINGDISYEVPDHNDNIFIGENDLKLMKQLVSAGTDHSKFMRMIIFSCDMNAPIYWWKEMDTYKVGTVRNSCSTMHKIMEHEFTEKDFAFEHVREGYIDFVIRELNHLRKCYFHIKDMAPDNTSKDIWYELIQLLPSSYMQKATWTANYQVLRNIYHARKNHKLDEWHKFCDKIEKLPYSELITS